MLWIWIRIQWGPWIRIRIHKPDADADPGGQKWPKNIEKKKKFKNVIVWSAGCSLLRGLKASPKKDNEIFSCIFFLQFLVIKTMDPDWIRIHLKWMNPDPQLCIYPERISLASCPRKKTSLVDIPALLEQSLLVFLPLHILNFFGFDFLSNLTLNSFPIHKKL